MRYLITLLLASTLIPTASAQYRPDILGEGFEQRTIEAFEDAPATLIRNRRNIGAERAILYIHGYNDYFFQAEMANRLCDSLYSFYAIDLHKYGRSLRPDQRPFEVRDMEEYFDELDQAVEIIRAEGAECIILMGHSTGGLLASLYCGLRQDAPPVDALILNSPFLDMNLSWSVELFGIPAVAALGRFLPDFVASPSGSSSYFDSIHSDAKGEWSFDPNLKFKRGQPITAGWIRAISRAHTRVQGGFDLETPILLMYSDKSTLSSGWSPEYQCSDSVLDVEDIALYGDRLGRNVTHCEVVDGMHDLFLSNYTAREYTYKSIFNWLSQLRGEHPAAARAGQTPR